MNLPTRTTDPSGLFGSIGTAVGALLALLVAFGVDLTQEQVTSILGVVAAVGPLVTAWAIRRYAWAPQSVENLRAELDNTEGGMP